MLSPDHGVGVRRAARAQVNGGYDVSSLHGGGMNLSRLNNLSGPPPPCPALLRPCGVCAKRRESSRPPERGRSTDSAFSQQFPHAYAGRYALVSEVSPTTLLCAPLVYLAALEREC